MWAACLPFCLQDISFVDNTYAFNFFIPACMEAYSHTKDRYACNLGCASMAKQKKVSNHFVSIR
jgi:hypothetical protein